MKQLQQPRRCRASTSELPDVSSPNEDAGAGVCVSGAGVIDGAYGVEAVQSVVLGQ